MRLWSRTSHPQTVSAPPAFTPLAREAIEIPLSDIRVVEELLLYSLRIRRERRPDFSGDRGASNLIAELYQRAGAASVVESDPDAARVPFYKDEFMQIEWAIQDLQQYSSLEARRLEAARSLLNKYNALLGKARATIHMGGTPVFQAPAPGLPGPR
jgi:hypothetical protein